MAKEYDRTRRPPPQIVRAICDRLVQLLPDDRPTVDIGTGTGRYSDQLRRLGARIVGLDRSREMLAEARRKGLRTLVLGSGAALPFRERAFGAALMVHLAHLVPDWPALLAEIARVTDGPLLSVVHRQRVAVDTVYAALVAARSRRPSQWGPAERDLIHLARPLERRHLLSYTDPLTVGETLDRLEHGVFSCSWRVPARLHRSIMVRLRKEFRVPRRRIRHDVDLVVWSPGALARRARVVGEGWRVTPVAGGARG